MSIIFKSMPMEAKANSTGNIVFKISTNIPDRDSDILEPSGVKLENYRNNPVVLFAHDYSSLPVGKSLWEKVYPDYIESEVEFAPTAFAQDCKKLCEGNFLNAASVGFIGIESKPIDGSQWGKRYTSWELLEWSVVPVPSNFGSLIQNAKAKGLNLDAMEKELNQLEQKSAIPYKKYPLADEGAAWDGAAEIAVATVEDLKLMCAWYDEENPDVKQSYKLPHHTQSDKNTVWRAVMAAMAALFGARGGVDIPEADRKGVYDHLSKHYADFEKEPPEFKSYTDFELKTVFGTEIKKADLEGNPSVSDIYDALWKAVNPAEIYARGGPYVEDLYPIRYPDGNVVIEKMDKYYLYQYEYKDGIATLTSEGVELDEVYVPKSYKHKSGATISAKNRELLNAIHVGMDENLKKLKGFIDTAMPMMGPDGMPMMEPMMTAQMTAPAMTANMTADMTAGMTMTMPMMEPMMSAMRTAIAGEVKQALDEIKNQVSLLLPKDATKAEIDLDAIELPMSAKDPDKIELNIEPGELKTMIQETIKNLIQGGN